MKLFHKHVLSRIRKESAPKMAVSLEGRGERRRRGERIVLAEIVALRRDEEDASRGSFRMPFRLCRQRRHLVDTVGAAQPIRDDANRERDQRQLVRASLAINPTNGSMFQVARTIVQSALLMKLSQNMLVEDGATIRSCHHDKIIAANMANKIIGIAILIDHTLTNATDQ